MNEMARFKIPGSFIAGRMTLTATEVAYGRRWGWLDDHSSVQILLAKLQEGGELSEAEERWALALPEEVRCGDLPDISASNADDSPEVTAVWVYLSMAWLHENVPARQQLFDIIEELYADFGYPEEIEGFVKYMPPPPGGRAGIPGMTERLESFLRAADAFYRNR
ncbi:DUF2247 family protein [Streptomyces sp. NPDC051569]|uniref:DUF2247 family protein n=1 Tax=Streptomyces sp. NPDC051569 TaxID=3365661 RepID=UPI00378F3A04